MIGLAAPARDMRPESPGRPSAFAALMAGASLEVMPRRTQDAATLAGLLAPGTHVFIPHLPEQALNATVDMALALRRAGLEPVPHVAARRVPSAVWLDELMARLRGEAGVRRALAIGGDAPSSAGPYADALALLRSPAFQRSGFRELLIGGYPDGHPSVSAQSLRHALDDKIAAVGSLGADCTVVTQFGFNSAAIIAFADEMARSHPNVGLRLGLAGPAKPLTLLNFAMACGVLRTARSASGMGFKALRLIGAGDPSALAGAIAEGLARTDARRTTRFHFFAFGGAAATARWMAERTTPPTPSDRALS